MPQSAPGYKTLRQGEGCIWCSSYASGS